MSEPATIGELRHKIDIQSRVDVPDGVGGFTTAWTTSTSPWAKIETKSGREIMFAGKVKHRVTHAITIRARTGIVSSMRVVFDGRVFHIHGVRELEFKNRWMVLDCEEGSAS